LESDLFKIIVTLIFNAMNLTKIWTNKSNKSILLELSMPTYAHHSSHHTTSIWSLICYSEAFPLSTMQLLPPLPVEPPLLPHLSELFTLFSVGGKHVRNAK
jgi:hypothetical protein